MSARQRDVQQTRYDLIYGGRVQIDNDQTLSGESDSNVRGKIKPVSNEAIRPSIASAQKGSQKDERCTFIFSLKSLKMPGGK